MESNVILTNKYNNQNQEEIMTVEEVKTDKNLKQYS